MLYIIVAILIFGFLIATHELGHFATAKLLGVKVNEFSVGMGPAIFKREKGETLYSVRALPIGGYCAMEGEDDDSADPRAFGRAAGWKKFLILCAGAVMNFVTGVVILVVLYSNAPGFYQPVLKEISPGFGLEDCGLQGGDVVVSLDGHRIYNYGNLSMFLSRAGEDMDWIVERDGEKIKLEDVHMPLQESGTDENGQTLYRRGIVIGQEVLPATPLIRLQYSWYTAMDYVRMVWISLGDLISGAVGLNDMAGPVGIITTISEMGSNEEISPTAMDAVRNIASLAALIAVNLAVMNLLPLPALDGGRIFFLLLNGILYTLFKKKIDPKYEGYVHMAGLAALMALMLIVTVSDVGKIIGR